MQRNSSESLLKSGAVKIKSVQTLAWTGERTLRPHHWLQSHQQLRAARSDGSLGVWPLLGCPGPKDDLIPIYMQAAPIQLSGLLKLIKETMELGGETDKRIWGAF